MAPPVVNFAPIKGVYRRRLVIDLASALTAGLVASELYWHGLIIPHLKKKDAYLAKIEKQKADGTYHYISVD